MANAKSGIPAADHNQSAVWNGDLALSLVILVFGALLLLWIIPAQVNDAGSFGLPPSLAPKALAWLMIGTGIVLLGQQLRAKPADQGSGLSLTDTRFMVAVIATLIVMLVVMQQASAIIERPFGGFLVAAPLGLIAFTWLHGNAPFWAYIFNAVAAPLLIYAGFWWGLRLPLP